VPTVAPSTSADHKPPGSAPRGTDREDGVPGDSCTDAAMAFGAKRETSRPLRRECFPCRDETMVLALALGASSTWPCRNPVTNVICGLRFGPKTTGSGAPEMPSG